MLNVKRGVDPYADAEAVRQAISYAYLPYEINATDLAAGTAVQLISPVKGKLVKNTSVVTTAIVTGGDITVNKNGSAVTGLTNTHADSAVVGNKIEDAPTSDTTVDIGDRLAVVPAAAFNGGGAIAGFLTIERTDN